MGLRIDSFSGVTRALSVEFSLQPINVRSNCLNLFASAEQDPTAIRAAVTVLLVDLLGALQIMLPLEAPSSLTRKVVPYIAGFKLLSLDRNE